jgi:predicted lipoprotein with Yx(FWY)xxD motif
MKTLIVALMTSSVAFGTLAGAATSTKQAMMGTTSMGKAWVDAKGMALYTFDKDKGGKSMCNDKCATVWPPLAVAKDGKAAGYWTIVIRDDKSKMWAYKGHPLYTFIDDKKPGEVTGDNKDGFHLAK